MTRDDIWDDSMETIESKECDICSIGYTLSIIDTPSFVLSLHNKLFVFVMFQT